MNTTQSQKAIKTPDWMPQSNNGRYESDKVLGLLHRALSSKMDLVITGVDSTGADLGLDPRIQEVVNEFSKSPKYAEYLAKMKDSVTQYWNEYAEYRKKNPINSGSRTENLTESDRMASYQKAMAWKSSFFARKRAEVMENSAWGLESSLSGDQVSSLGVEVRRDIRAALLYLAGWQLHEAWVDKQRPKYSPPPPTGGPHSQHRHSYGYSSSGGGHMEYVWGIAHVELISLFGGQDRNSLLLDSSVEHTVFARRSLLL